MSRAKGGTRIRALAKFGGCLERPASGFMWAGNARSTHDQTHNPCSLHPRRLTTDGHRLPPACPPLPFPALPCPRCLCCAPVTLCAGDSDEPAAPPPCFRLHITETSKRLSGSGSSRIAAPWVQARVNLLALALIPPVRMHQLQRPIPPSHNSGPLRCCIFRLPAHPLAPLTAQSGTSNPELTSTL